ncbi:hypothetical protein [Kribbella sp. NPDC049584]|uniref:hypothetical protein n=1 Tax=Kribbella sp. NPDC049584 TaxID=3154833 RepID=UPI00343DBA56
MNQWSLERINAFAEATSWLRGGGQASVGYGVGLCAGLLLGSWWIGRRSEESRVAGTITAGGPTLLLLPANRAIVHAAALIRLLAASLDGDVRQLGAERRPLTHLVGATAGARLRPIGVTAGRPRLS